MSKENAVLQGDFIDYIFYIIYLPRDLIERI